MKKLNLFELFITSTKYVPEKLSTPSQMINVPSAWVGLEQIIEDILDRFQIERERCIEFGVEFGYSTVVLSNFFKSVIGVDTFEGDEHTLNKSQHYESTSKKLSKYSNIKLVKSDYKDWITKDSTMYDFAHVDIVHNYNETFECGLWAANHSRCTIFHDTVSFPAVKRAVRDIAKATNKKFYNYPRYYGLGIVVG
jgi:hypothetical protein